MARSKDQAKKSKKKKKETPAAAEELDESLLLGDDLDTSKTRRSAGRQTSLNSSLLEAELLEESPVGQTKRRNTRSRSGDTNKKCKADNILDVSIEINLEDQNTLLNKTCSEIVATTQTVVGVADSNKSDTVHTEPPDKEPDTTSEQADPLLSTQDIPATTQLYNTAPPPTIPIDKSVVQRAIEEEVDIYSDLSADNFEQHATDNTGDEITYEDVFKMTDKATDEQHKKKQRKSVSSEKEEEDLDYEEEEEEEDCSQMKISVLVSKAGDSGHEHHKRRVAVRQEVTPTSTQTRDISRDMPPLILPPLPQHISIPPMLPLPPVALLPPPLHQQYRPSMNRGSSKKKIYINPKFKTEVILQNLESAGILKGGNVAVHINRRPHRERSRSPIRCHSQQEYVPSPIIKQKGLELDQPTTTLLITDLSVCTTRSRLKQLFSSIGNVKEVLTYPQERRAVVTFEYAKDAVICRRKFHRSMVDGSMMSVNFAI